ncbi:1-(5-phosphoribosyl)-5-[(5-phosphoribosylamino)methylideneamino]imidazole-4-carboxamide isomerase [Myxococcota bacterium]|nr:1-(5-phosphoribosyl)-5-[(5-phosphoribosylamino)methylideneamino]imidazole-4-carboxamide isomerase [Myxococcota bacterium]
MLIIPAIDLRDGRCVRLVEGRAGTERVYGDDPVAQAEAFADEGATRVHLVDLDGAFEGRPKNGDVIEAIARALAWRGVEVEVGGGLRDRATVDAVLASNVRYAIVGTLAITDPALFRELCAAHPGRIIAGIDAKKGKVATEGWVKESERLAIDLARDVEAAGAAAIIYTDIARDGTGKGVNVEETEALARAVSIPVIASGGVASLDDVERLAGRGIAGVVIGRAIYEGAIRVAEAIQRAGA